MTGTAAAWAQRLLGDAAITGGSLYLQVAGTRLRIEANRAAMLDLLARYFAHVAVAPGDADMTVRIVDGAPPELDVAFIDWRREPGKSGRKDSYVDLADGRLVRKVRTGMVFLQSETWRVAAGPCLRYDNQVINFINAQFMNRLQQQGWLICHAAGLVRDGAALAIAGLSGGGKSTLMLQLLEDPAVNYLTNDRLFVRPHDGQVDATGIPKLPRVNPGTIVHNPRLRSLIPDPRRAELLAMPGDALWALEEKHDVLIDLHYGAGRIADWARLAAFAVLNWQRGGGQPVRVERVDLQARDDLLGAIMKSPGPFYQYADGRLFADTMPLDGAAYRRVLRDVPIFEISGSVDFAAAARQLETSEWWCYA
ncbi:MAG: HprK-related kinase B [Gammaproteobacteria bacterium]|nr:HprK-related kinase B [Gammaproteobacteria bacterium]